MKNKIILSTIVFALSMIMSIQPVMAQSADSQRVTLGANLDYDQINEIYIDFNVERGTVKELFVTNEEERKYLDGLVPDEAIGRNAISSIYIMTLDEGKGISVETKNINWCTEGMYINALETAGIKDAKIIVSAPFEVSGTAALMGIYKAYADITGVPLDELSMVAATKELVVTGNISEEIGGEDATKLVGELKKILDQTKDMSDSELREEILYIASVQNVNISEENISQVISLCRTLEKADLDDWLSRFRIFGQSMDKAQKAKEDVGGFFTSIKDFFNRIVESF
jgi:uncharacterized protein YpuA (DUF1002 family)